MAILGRRWSWKGKILLAFGVALFGFVGLGWFAFGLRLPPIQWEPSELPTMQEDPSGSFFVEADGAYFKGLEQGVMVFRAFVPEPTLIVSAKRDAAAEVVLENVSPKLEDRGIKAGKLDGLTRTYRFDLSPGVGLVLQPRFPADKTSFRFAAIGDTGGGQEMQRALLSAGWSDCDFLLHLGDIEYEEGAIVDAAIWMDQATLPTYVAIGNHDFHDGLRLVHRSFRDRIGPRNSHWTTGGVRFINVDTAADTYPAHAGNRGTMVRRLLKKEPATGDVVLLTHRPILDPREPIDSGDEGHAVGSAIERAWLMDRFRELNVSMMLHGHIHQSIAYETDGIPTYIVGNGLGLPEQDSSRAMPSLLIGEWTLEAPQVQVRWEPLER